jgi:hypothetical protein
MVKQLEKRNEQDGSPNTRVKSREVAFICGRDRAKSPRNTCKARLRERKKREKREREREKEAKKKTESTWTWGMGQHTNSVSDKSNLLA